MSKYGAVDELYINGHVLRGASIGVSRQITQIPPCTHSRQEATIYYYYFEQALPVDIVFLHLTLNGRHAHGDIVFIV
jgi:hypothetical protein